MLSKNKKVMQSIINVVDLGKKDYKETRDIQKIIHQKRVENSIADTLILVEHNPVITMGKRGKEDNLLMPLKLLKKKGIEFYKIERGGDVTFHGPGQIVGYPIFSIGDGLVGIKPFIRKLEEVIILSLKHFGIEGEKKEKLIGVWTKAGKICSIGIAVQRWVSFHGFALNVHTDLRFFDYIIPCGLKEIKMTSMAQILKKEIAMADVREVVKKNFAKVFKKNIIELLDFQCLEKII